MSTTTIYVAREIITMNPMQASATHVAVRDGRILGVGQLDELVQWGDYTLDTRFADCTLMPGLIDAHTHLMFSTVAQMTVLTGDIGFVHVAAARAAEDTLMRGFTSVQFGQQNIDGSDFTPALDGDSTSLNVGATYRMSENATFGVVATMGKHFKVFKVEFFLC